MSIVQFVRNYPAGRLFAWTLVAALFLPAFATRGMFLDGTLYAGIAHNLSIGQGGRWHLMTQQPWFEHPPLHFWLESLFFSNFGSGWWVEKLFSALVLVLTILLIRHIWLILFRLDLSRRDGYWLAVVLWYLIPTVNWGMPSNMLENTMGLFCLGSIAMVLKAGQAPEKQAWKWYSYAGLLVFAGFLVKGPVALFPLAAPFIDRFLRRAAAHLPRWWAILIPTLVFVACMGLLWQFAPARAYLQTYFDVQVLGSLEGRREMGDKGLGGHFYLLGKLFTEAAVPLLFCLAAFWAGKKRLGQRISFAQGAWFAVLVFATAYFPLLLSIKQRTYYLLPALPWLAIALAAWAYPYLGHWKAKGRSNLNYWSNLVLLGLLLLSLVFAVVRWGKPGRDRDFLQMVDTLKQEAPLGSEVYIPENLRDDYQLHAYCLRFGPWPLRIEKGEAHYALARHCKEGDDCYRTFVKPLLEEGWTQVVANDDFILLKSK